MKRFTNKTNSIKLILVFMPFAVLMIVLGIVGGKSIGNIQDNVDIYNKHFLSKKTDADAESYPKYNLSVETKKYIEQFKKDWKSYSEERDNGLRRVPDLNNYEINAVFDGKSETAPVNGMLFIFILMEVAAASLLGLFISKIISNSLKKLSLTADKYTGGDIDVNADIRINDEIGRLEQSFKLMVDNIKVQAGNAEKITQENLSAKVELKSEQDVLSKNIKNR